MNLETGENLCSKLKKLIEAKKLPIKEVPVDTILYRVQPVGYESSFHFNAPDDDLGRYNDPSGRLKICYVAESPVVALAETYGRLRAADKSMGYLISKDELSKKAMAASSTKSALRLVNIEELMAQLGLTLDELSGPDYSVTQAIVESFAELASLEKVDGIRYPSRHYGGTCLALWTEGDGGHLLESSDQTALDSFETDSVGFMPSWWGFPRFDAEDVLSQVLDIGVV